MFGSLSFQLSYPDVAGFLCSAVGFEVERGARGQRGAQWFAQRFPGIACQMDVTVWKDLCGDVV